MRKKINLKALIYLWTRDAEMLVNQETENYIVSHLQKIGNTNEFVFSDKPRSNLVERILELI